ncbi:radical SAM protein [Desulfobacter vibrioformis]|uniref:radical SAM protein n=1 Tax=Desulfobacter vibrioformis TaxID=34031 RepID=UPI00055078BC|nr:radical SAM protein [Desulfobacter vibrioformis]
MIRTALGIIKAGLLKRPVPIYCHWEYTFRCNLACAFCTLQSGPNVWTPETTTGQAAQLVDQLADLGTAIIHFVGGEPTLRRDLGETAARARSRGILTAVTSNGFVRESDLDALSKMQFIRISLTGPYDREDILGKKSKRLDPVATLEALLETGAKPEIASTFSAATTEEDIQYVLNTARRLNTPIGLNFVGVGVSNLKGFTREDLQHRKDELQPLLMDQGETLTRLRKLIRNHADIVQNTEDFLDMVESGGLGRYGCRAMDTALSLKADGSVAMPCIEFAEKSQKGDLVSVFYGPEAQKVRKRQGREWYCKDCSLSCMYSSSRLLRLSSLPEMAKRYLRSVRLL